MRYTHVFTGTGLLVAIIVAFTTQLPPGMSTLPDAISTARIGTVIAHVVFIAVFTGLSAGAGYLLERLQDRGYRLPRP